MPPNDTSNIRVFVHWHEQTVFSGEEVKCTITFKNVAQKQQKQPPPPSAHSERQRLAPSLHGRATANAAGLNPPTANGSGRGHRRSALSLNISSAGTRSHSESIQWPPSASTVDGRPNHVHKRSVSIVSIGSAATTTIEDSHQRIDGSTRPPLRASAGRGHNRAASLQMPSRGGPGSPLTSSRSASFSPRNTSSPTFSGSYPPDRARRMNSLSSVTSPPSAGGHRRSPGSPNPMPEFRFPAAPPPETTHSHTKSVEDGFLSPNSGQPNPSALPVRTKDSASVTPERPAARILTSTSIPGGTPRSSGEFYPMSNNSTETLASEYPAQRALGGPTKPPHLRRSSGMSPQQVKQPESLMMGYAQIQGSFVLDGSLVSLSPFEHVKKKAVVGGRGGVVGLEQNKRESGLLRGFGWGSISSSLGDFLGGNELSTIKEIRGATNSRSVPLLSTPQSILFVDLQLQAGESRVFEYSFKLPQGLPPSHRGKAVKISYSVVIGTQRAGGVNEQQVRSVEAPFRVLGSVNKAGEILGHDLMTPYNLLRDQARVRSLGKTGKKPRERDQQESTATINEFLAYVDELASKPQRRGEGTLLSPSVTAPSHRGSIVEEATTAREAIHLAILRSNLTTEGQQSPNRFEIARNGQRVGVVMLTRPSYRLGEVVTMAIDFADADLPCFAVHASLETTEKIDPSLAVRSDSSIQRVTRKVFAASSVATLYSRRVVFTPTIPISATPEFVTSGVSLEWKIRVEFVVPSHGEGDANSGMEARGPHPLLEQISRDEKGGLVLAAVENLACESFDVPVPLRVYGAVGSGLERLERDEAAEEGLVV